MVNSAWLPLLLLCNVTGVQSQTSTVCQAAELPADGGTFSLLQAGQTQRRVEGLSSLQADQTSGEAEVSSSLQSDPTLSKVEVPPSLQMAQTLKKVEVPPSLQMDQTMRKAKIPLSLQMDQTMEKVGVTPSLQMDQTKRLLEVLPGLQVDRTMRKFEIQPSLQMNQAERIVNDAKTRAGQASGGRTFPSLPVLFGRLAADPPSTNDGEEKPMTHSMLMEFGLAVLLGSVCVVGITSYQVWYRKTRLLEVLVPAAFWQVMTICMAVVIFLVQQFVNLPAYVVVFALGTLWNTIIHCKDVTLVTAAFQS